MDPSSSSDEESSASGAAAPRKISNDSADCSHCVDVAYEGEFPVEYSCDSFIDEDEEQSETTVSFGYEVAMPVSADVALNVRALKWRLLNEAVAATGLLNDCNFENQFDRRKLQSSPYLPKLEYPTTVFAVDSQPGDFPVEGDCQVMINSNPSSRCVPIQTQLAAKYRGSPADSLMVQEYIKSILATKMATSPNELLVQDVDEIVYVGETLRVPAATATADIFETREASITTKAMGSVVGAAAFALLIGVVFLKVTTTKRRKRRQHDQDEDEQQYTNVRKPVSDLRSIDLETGSETTLSSVPATACYYDSSSLESSSHHSLNMEVHQPIGESLRPELQQGTTIEHPTDSRTTNQLPPRPPRRGSITMKKKRRPRKKKKRAVLKRVNSKENVTQMEAIPESECGELEVEDDDEYYSTGSEDEGSASKASSTDYCLTPRPPTGGGGSNPGSRSSSRASSPQLSPRDENFPSGDVFSTDFDFVIEAPDFPFNEVDDDEECIGGDGDDAGDASPSTRPVILKPRSVRKKDDNSWIYRPTASE